MKVIALIALLGSIEALQHHHHHDHSLSKRSHLSRRDFLQTSLNANAEALDEVNAKVDEVEKVLAKKEEGVCDEACKKGCDATADQMIRELKNPMHDITWNCKNNYNTYTTDYDPEHNHFDRISMDVMATERTLNRI